MPEGDTAWNTATVLRDALVGKMLMRRDIRVGHLGGLTELSPPGNHALSGLQHRSSPRFRPP
jgi:hypothetical protein